VAVVWCLRYFLAMIDIKEKLLNRMRRNKLTIY
jgi:hypothetical protein